MKKNFGFSLVEILVVVAILATMSLIIATTLTQSLNAKKRLESQEEVMHSLRVIFTLMENDLSQAFLAHQAMEGATGDYQTDFIGTEDSINFSTQSGHHWMEDAKDTDTITVGYSLAPSKDDLFELTRRSSSFLGPKVDEGGKSVVLISSIKEMKLEYYDPTDEDWTLEWDSTKISHQAKLPMAIKISLSLVTGIENQTIEMKDMFLIPMSQNLVKF